MKWLGRLVTVVITVTAVTTGVAQAATASTCVLAAHRGDHTTATENGLKAMRAAVAAGAEFLEIDVRVTRDNRLVLMHDARVDRTTNGTGYVRDKTAEQVRALRLDDDGRVPYLNQVLDLAADAGVRVLLEVKAMGTADSYERLTTTIARHGNSRVTLTSFKRDLLDRLRKTTPKVKKAVVTSKALTVEQLEPYRRVAVHHAAITDDWLSRMKSAGIPVFAWTVDETDEWDRLASRVAGIITDDARGYAGYREDAPACQRD